MCAGVSEDPEALSVSFKEKDIGSFVDTRNSPSLVTPERNFSSSLLISSERPVPLY